MRCSEHPAQMIDWRRVVCRWYQMSLSLYPASFRRRFGPEMNAVFEEALDVQAGQGRVSLLSFLGREFIEVPFSAMHQRLANRAMWIKAYLQIILIYALSFLLLGSIDVWNASYSLTTIQDFIIHALTRIVLGGLGGLSVGIIVAPQRKTLFTLGGMVCMVTLFTSPVLLISYLLAGLGLAFLNWRHLLHLAGYGMLASLVCLLANRVSAAMVQSWLYHSPTQILSQTGPSMVLLPLLVSGVALGILFGGIMLGKSMTPG